MKPILQCILIGSVVVLVFDTLGALAATRLGFEYGLLSSVSMIVYGAIGFVAAKRLSLAAATLTAVGVGLVDATIGWAISSAIVPPLPEEPGDIQIPVWGTIAFVLLLAAACGFAGALVRRVIRPPPIADA